MANITLTQGKIVSLDDEDYNEIGCYLWYAAYENGRWYAVRWNNDMPLKMHRQILKLETAGSKVIVDHMDMNGLNNHKSNLRICNHSLNMANDDLKKNNTTGYKGVTKYKYVRKISYVAGIMINYKRIHLGSFDTDIEAAKAYDEAAKYFFGEFARLNFL